MAEIGIDFIEGGYPLSNEKDVAFFQKVRHLDLGNSQVCAFGMTRRRAFKAEDDPGMKALTKLWCHPTFTSGVYDSAVLIPLATKLAT